MRHLNDKLLKGSNIYNLINNINQRFQDMIIYGKSTQEITTGRQLLDVSSTYNTNKTTIDYDTGWVSVDYENNNSRAEYCNFFTNIPDGINVKANTNYAIFLEIKGIETDNVSNYLDVYHPATNFLFKNFVPIIHLNDISENKVYKYELLSKEDLSDVKCLLRTFVSIVPNSFVKMTFRLSVLEDTTITTDDFVYEKFTGGKSAPSPDFPMPIINKKIGNIELCSIDDSKDYIKGKPGEWYLYKTIRKLLLPVKSMNNADNYPGWKQTPETTILIQDFPQINGFLKDTTNFLLSVSNDSKSVRAGNVDTELMYLGKSIFNLSQSEWKTKYLDLIIILQYDLKKYEIKKITDKETIEALNNMYLEKIKENQQDIVID